MMPAISLELAADLDDYALGGLAAPRSIVSAREDEGQHRADKEADEDGGVRDG